jgi:hypothetical protein
MQKILVLNPEYKELEDGDGLEWFELPPIGSPPIGLEETSVISSDDVIRRRVNFQSYRIGKSGEEEYVKFVIMDEKINQHFEFLFSDARKKIMKLENYNHFLTQMLNKKVLQYEHETILDHIKRKIASRRFARESTRQRLKTRC